MNAAELVGVEKSFGRTRVLAGFDLTVELGERVVLLGPNGAGKTTALRILLGLRRADAGRVRLFDCDPSDVAGRRRVGCTPQETSFPSTLRVRELVDFVRSHYPTPAARHGLAEIEDRQVGGLSGGQRRRVACALAFAGDPDLVVLDEPSTGLDVESREALWSEICEQARAALITTHSFEEADALATRIVMLRDGRAEEISARGAALRSAYLELAR